jgi:hypothetical protein
LFLSRFQTETLPAYPKIARLLETGRRPLVDSFLPKGRTGLYIYAVVVKDHPDKVKVGMTRNWTARRNAYANWNLTPGDGVLQESVFCITEEFVDLPKLENHILKTLPLARASGSEWFFGSIDDASRHIDRVMVAHGISYSL